MTPVLLPLFLLLPSAVATSSVSTSSSLGSPAKVRRYAVVVGVNRPGKDGQKPLRFADDDAVRFFELFRQIAGEATLFSLLDDETQNLYPEVIAEAELPEKALVFRRIDRIFEEIETNREQGLGSEFYLVYSGHGYVDEEGEGRLSFLDGTFSRSELYDRVLSRSPADINHVIVDACDAYFFVQSRGGAGDDKKIEALLNKRAQEFLDRQSLTQFPNTGAILSTASAAETHEWSEIHAGVFSHEVRSALLGAADADQNGAISYDELEAFVLAANAGIRHVGASRAIFVRPPQRNRAHPVLELDALPRTHKLEIPSETSGRIALADERGRRYVDLHKAAGFRLALRLMPGIRYFVEHDNLEYRVPAGGDVSLASLGAGEPRTTTRGAGIAEAYARGLFAVPFGPQLVDGFRLRVKSQEIIPVRDPNDRPLRTVAWVSGGAAAIAGGLAAGFFVAGDAVQTEHQSTQDPLQKIDLERQVQAWDARTNVALGIAIGLGVSAGALLVLDALGVEL